MTTQTYSTPPTRCDLRYGPHERHVLDYWASRSGSVAPLVVWYHGGGFAGGDKTIIRDGLLEVFLDGGFAVASVNYRLSDQAASPDIQMDGARGLQFLRANADELKFDPQRVALAGSSAGAGMSQWIAFHKDLADPASDDPVLRQSTRVSCIVIRNGQCSYDPRLYLKLGLDAAARSNFLAPLHGIKPDQYDTPQAHAAFNEAAPVTYIRPDAPPVFAYYTNSLDPLPTAPDPAEPDQQAAWSKLTSLAVHHAALGVHLKQKLEAVGCICQLEVGLQDPQERAEKILAFLREHLAA